MPASPGGSARVDPHGGALFLADTRTHMPHRYYLSVYLNRPARVENNKELIKAVAENRDFIHLGAKEESMICPNHLHISNNYYICHWRCNEVEYDTFLHLRFLFLFYVYNMYVIQKTERSIKQKKKFNKSWSNHFGRAVTRKQDP